MCGNFQLIIWTRPAFSSFCGLELNYERGSRRWQSEPACQQAESRAAHENRPGRNLIFSFHICFLLFTVYQFNRTSFRSYWMHCFALVLHSEVLVEICQGISVLFVTCMYSFESAEKSKYVDDWDDDHDTMLKQVLLSSTLWYTYGTLNGSVEDHLTWLVKYNLCFYCVIFWKLSG